MAQHLGQHFLLDSSIARREVQDASLTKDDVVLEIGPGKGALTRLLAASARQVIAIEIDPCLVHQLSLDMPSNVQVIQGDAAAIDFTSLPRFTKVVANLPFWISSAITSKLLEHSFEKAVLIYQWEFAQRLVAGPGTKHYSRLSVLVVYKATCHLLERVPRESFSPPPEVDAAIVELVPRGIRRSLSAMRRSSLRWSVGCFPIGGRRLRQRCERCARISMACRSLMSASSSYPPRKSDPSAIFFSRGCHDVLSKWKFPREPINNDNEKV